MGYTDQAETQAHINCVNQKGPDIKQTRVCGIIIYREKTERITT